MYSVPSSPRMLIAQTYVCLMGTRFSADSDYLLFRFASYLAESALAVTFCAKVMGAGCAGYLVSLLGKRVVYYGRAGEIHTEYFPGSKP